MGRPQPVGGLQPGVHAQGLLPRPPLHGHQVRRRDPRYNLIWDFLWYNMKVHYCTWGSVKGQTNHFINSNNASCSMNHFNNSRMPCTLRQWRLSVGFPQVLPTLFFSVHMAKDVSLLLPLRRREKQCQQDWPPFQGLRTLDLPDAIPWAGSAPRSTSRTDTRSISIQAWALAGITTGKGRNQDLTVYQ